MTRIQQSLNVLGYLLTDYSQPAVIVRVLLNVAEHGNMTAGELEYETMTSNQSKHLVAAENIGLIRLAPGNGAKAFELTEAGQDEVRKILAGPERVAEPGPEVDMARVNEYVLGKGR